MGFSQARKTPDHAPRHPVPLPGTVLFLLQSPRGTKEPKYLQEEQDDSAP